MTTIPTVRFRDGHEIPQLGYGVWKVEDEVAETVVGQAIDAGYRHIDTARIYGNEEGVGRAIAATSVPREDLFITTKLWNDDQKHDDALKAIDDSLARLQLDHVDLYLIHWAAPHRGTYLEAWKAMQEIHESGKATSIGVSNFPVAQLEEIIEATGSVPVIHQIEVHPYHQQRELRAANEKHGIVTQAYSPLGHGGELLQDPVITEIAEAKGATPAQVVLAWHLAHGIVAIPKSVTEERIISNFKAADVTLTEDELARIDALDKGDEGRVGADPATMDF